MTNSNVQQPQTKAFSLGGFSDIAAVAQVSAGKYPHLTLVQARRDGEHWQEPAQSLNLSGPKCLEDLKSAVEWLLENSKQPTAAAPTVAPAPALVESAEQLFWNTRSMLAVQALNDIKSERYRQMMVEGWTAAHDDEHSTGTMAIAAACYALVGWRAPLAVQTVKLDKLWEWTGWAFKWFKPKDTRRDLIRAAALLLAEIERLDRAAAKLKEAADKGDRNKEAGK